MKFAIFLALLFLMIATPSLAEEDGERSIEGYPGWTLELVKPEPNEDGTPNYRTSYFVLKPPDKRPAASITSRAAQRVKSGELGPEAAYNGGSAEAVAEKKDSATAAASLSGVSNAPPGGGGMPAVSGISTSPDNRTLASPEQNGSGLDQLAAASTSPATSASDSSGSSSKPGSGNSNSAVVVKVDNAKGGTMQSGVLAVAQCAPTTIGGCAIASGGAGTCVSGFTGGCSYSCVNGVWAKAQNTCTAPVPAQVKACSSVEDCMRVAGVSYHLIGTTQGFIDSNAGYICSKVGKATVVSAVASDVSSASPNGTKAYMVSLCSRNAGCQDKSGSTIEFYQGLGRGPKAVSSVECR